MSAPANLWRACPSFFPSPPGSRWCLALALLLGLGAVSARACAADLEAGKQKAETVCASCHSSAGQSKNPRAPSLAAQPVFYLHWQLILFRDRRRVDPEMSPFAANLSETEMADLAAYYNAQKPVAPASVPRNATKIAAGRAASERHHCVSCHAPNFGGQQYAPRLAGLSYEYLLRQLRGFKSQTRGELDGTMTTAAQPLTEQDVDNLAHYIATVLDGS